MITNTEPLWSYLQDLRNSGVDVAVFKTQSEKRYALRVIDPEDRNTGLAFLASFSSKMREADRPADAAGRLAASQRLNGILNDAKQAAKYVVCFCVIDEDSLASFSQYSEKDLGKTFLIIATAGTVTSDEAEYADAGKEPKTVSADDAPAPRRNSRRNGRVS